MKNYFAGLAAALLLAVPLLGRAQGVGIGTATPDASAALEVAATGRGLLVPRLTAAQRTGIAAPATGLLVYQTDGAQPGFWHFAAAGGWTFINPTGADNLGNHAATQNLALAGNALTGTGASVGAAVGLGARADGGLNIGQNTVGNNLFLGYQAGQANAFGSQNQFVGYQSGQANTSGTQNQFSGYQSGYSNTSGTQNQFNGYQSGVLNTTGSQNQFDGFWSGYFNTTGTQNQFSGYRSGYRNTTGNNNVFSGFFSGELSATGSNNTALGYNSGPGGSLDNTTAIGSGARVGSSNHIQLGNAAVTALRCQVGLTVLSDARFKYDVRPDVPGLAFITRLRPVTYRLDAARQDGFQRTGTLPAFTPDATAPLHTGFLAQEVEATARALGYAFDGVHAPATARDTYGLAYAQFVVPLVRAVQELSQQVADLKAQNTALQSQAAAFAQRLRALEAAGTQATASH